MRTVQGDQFAGRQVRTRRGRVEQEHLNGAGADDAAGFDEHLPDSQGPPIRCPGTQSGKHRGSRWARRHPLPQLAGGQRDHLDDCGLAAAAVGHGKLGAIW